MVIRFHKELILSTPYQKNYSVNLKIVSGQACYAAEKVICVDSS